MAPTPKKGRKLQWLGEVANPAKPCGDWKFGARGCKKVVQSRMNSWKIIESAGNIHHVM